MTVIDIYAYKKKIPEHIPLLLLSIELTVKTKYMFMEYRAHIRHHKFANTLILDVRVKRN